jgi:hypothetical protein
MKYCELVGSAHEKTFTNEHRHCQKQSARKPCGSADCAGKALLRQLREALEDLEDREELLHAKKRNAAKLGVDWNAVKKEFGWRFWF